MRLLHSKAKASQEKQVRREARRYRVASAALVAAEAYAKALAEERCAVEAAICHVAPARDENGDETGEVEEGDAGGGGEAHGVASTSRAPLDSSTGLRPLVAKLQDALRVNEGLESSELPAQLLQAAEKPWAHHALSQLVAVEEVLEWEAWSTLFLW